jgi:hypothetical protein
MTAEIVVSVEVQVLDVEPAALGPEEDFLDGLGDMRKQQKAMSETNGI